MSIQEMQELQEDALEKFVKHIASEVDMLASRNLGTTFLVLAVNKQGQLVTISTNNIGDSLTRINLLAQATQAEVINLQRAMHQAAQAETIRLVQKATEAMTKN